MFTTTLSAANKLRNQVLAVPGTVLIGQAGHPDKVIRLEHTPEYLKQFTKKKEKYIFINMDRGPDQEAWNTAMREVFSTAKRDRPVPNPIPVAKDSHEEWSVSPEDVPLIENGLPKPEVSQSLNPTKVIEAVESKIFKCQSCGTTWDSNRALATHERFAHKK